MSAKWKPKPFVIPLSEQDPFPFGHWKGTPMCEVDAKYLVGAYKDGVFKGHPRLTRYIKQRIKALEGEADEIR